GEDGARPDGGWKGGAARRDEEEETVTRVRLEEEPSTFSEGKTAGGSPRTATRPWGLEEAARQARGERPRRVPQPPSHSPYKSVPTMRPRMPSEKAPHPSVPPPPPPRTPSIPPPPQRTPSIPPAPKRSTPPPPVKSSA